MFYRAFNLLKELILPQHRLKKKINRYIKNKNSSRRKNFYYTYIRDSFAVKYGIEIGVKSRIKGCIDFPHPRNIVIGEGVVIGEHCTIFNNVTIGQHKGYYPIIGDNVTIYPGATLIGEIHIGNNVVIGANSLVNKSVEDNCIVAGNPAKLIKKRKNEIPCI